MTSPPAGRPATSARRRSWRARPERSPCSATSSTSAASAAEFRDCYSWRRFRGRTRAALGNHEYGSAGARPAKAYFRLPNRGYYSYDLGAWHVVVLNSNCAPAGGCADGSPQQRWLAADLARSTARCTLGYWHHPRFSSGLHGSDRTMAALWRTLARAGADVVLAGHDHHYERFAPIDGIRSFVVGTGGRSHYPVLWRVRGSQVVNDTTFGVLRLDAPRGLLRLALPPGRGLELLGPRLGPLPLGRTRFPRAPCGARGTWSAPEVR